MERQDNPLTGPSEALHNICHPRSLRKQNVIFCRFYQRFLKPSLQLIIQNTIRKIRGMRYSKISYTKRIKLLNLIENQGYGVSQAARLVKMKIPTAKAILYLYRNEQRIFVKRNDAPVEKPTQTITPIQIKEEAIDLNDENIQQENQGPVVYYPMMYWVPFSFPGV